MSETTVDWEVPLLRRATKERNFITGRLAGQSLSEFALVLPVLLLLLLFGIDFGRVFLGWVELNNVVREAANFAAENPQAWNTVNPDNVAKTEYARLVTADAAGINCALPGTVPDPSFPNGPNGPNAIGQPVTVQITCSFSLITPVISRILGNPLPVTASAAFPIRNGTIAGIPVQTSIPTSIPSSSPSPTPAPTPTPSGCVVPDLVGQSTKFAADIWGTKGHGSMPGADFSTLNLTFSPAVGGAVNDYTIKRQSLPAGGAPVSCTTTAMTVYSTP